jgi:hypothetical protein
MKCKDSDAFALEKYMDELLDFNSWKNTYQLIVDFEDIDKKAYLDLVKTKLDKSMTSDKNTIVEFIDTVMNKLCFLFPMKYERCKSDTHSSKILFKSPNKDLVELPQNTYMYKRRLGFNL